MSNNKYINERLKLIAQLLKKLNEEIHKLSKILK